MSISKPGQAQGRRLGTIVSEDDKRMMLAIERVILAYQSGHLVQGIELAFPGASYRAFFLAYCRSCDPLRWLEAEGRA
jgi:hypothetical protein